MSTRGLGAIRGHDARDELGLGTIRDSFADTFFPGISSIQSRVRYFLFVQWCCEIAATGSDRRQIIERLRAAEVALIKALSPLGEGQGVIGISSQEDLARMPSEIYWNGLSIMRMRRVGGNRQRWVRFVSSAAERAHQAPPSEDGTSKLAPTGFDQTRPPPPKGFPSVPNLNFDLTPDEANFLRERLVAACVDPSGRGHEHNLFGPFTSYRRRTAVGSVWDHPQVPRLRSGTRDVLKLAAAFARVMHGASILYNVCVAELILAEGGAMSIRDRHRAAFQRWIDGLLPEDVSLVRTRMEEVHSIARHTRHKIDPGTFSFVKRWAQLCEPGGQLAMPKAMRLVSDREVSLKAKVGTSRIRSRKARQRWNGESGGMMDYRWNVARAYLNDLAAAA